MFSSFPLSAAADYATPSQWQTTWDRSKLFTSLAPSSPINFVTPGPIGSADIVVNDGTVYQPIAGFGGSLSNTEYFYSFLIDAHVCDVHDSGYLSTDSQ